jgi:hypothetical protein
VGRLVPSKMADEESEPRYSTSAFLGQELLLPALFAAEYKAGTNPASGTPDSSGRFISSACTCEWRDRTTRMNSCFRHLIHRSAQCK